VGVVIRPIPDWEGRARQHDRVSGPVTANEAIFPKSVDISVNWHGSISDKWHVSGRRAILGIDRISRMSGLGGTQPFSGRSEIGGPMPKYHINIRTESHIATTVDVERDDHTALRIELARFVGELLKDHAELIWTDEDWQIDVSDDDGLILYVMHISAMKTPATMANKN
jgi:hypothetical protein